MAGRLANDVAQRITQLLFADFGDNRLENFLRAELSRESYLAQFRKSTDEEILDFARYQREIYLAGRTPDVGRIIACFNPTFIDGIDSVVLEHAGDPIWTMASLKENGYRMQLHVGEQPASLTPGVSAYTRQFTRYDLRLFPELEPLFAQLPVIIGDAELISAHYEHLAGFNRVEKRLPNAKYWPAVGELGLPDDFVEDYLKDPHLFVSGDPGKVQKEFELMLSFHGLFAIADPATWNQSRDVQQRSLISLCSVPKNYQQVDQLLSLLGDFLRVRDLPARVVARQIIKSASELQAYVAAAEERGLEGVCVAQYADLPSEEAVRFAKTYKIKNFETVDAALLGLYLHEPLSDDQQQLCDDNLRGALLGIYDPALAAYVPAFKVNLDPRGVQIKTEGQRERLQLLREQILQEVTTRNAVTDEAILMTLQDVYVAYGERLFSETLGADYGRLFAELSACLPRGQDFLSLLEHYQHGKAEFESCFLGSRQTDPQRDRFIQCYKEIFNAVTILGGTQPDSFKTLVDYLSHAKKVRQKTKTLQIPEILLATDAPIVLEGKVFNIKYNLNGCAAGFSPQNCQSLHMSNAYAERVRYDKTTTTDVATIERIARQCTV